ncbi:MAG: RpiB/LacA/LacB family sugar-phosphate isomerase [Actinobacteria bacterium]|nr:RpiB/LacA/LacB family sugar-phosphate isomerase [Actinomycetota bacterium]MCL5445450.1 RpiB/LacA/LacB family sugar-phosphate isomerase [Actinomycetota bacterium]
MGHDVEVVSVGEDWAKVGRLVAELVASGSAERGLLCCTTGTGVTIAANRVRGTRAALCTDSETAVGARRWNDANVLAFSLRLTTEALLTEMLTAFFDTPFDPSESASLDCLDQIDG